MNSQPTLGITEQAIARVSDLVAQKGSPDLYLRVFVRGGMIYWIQEGWVRARSGTIEIFWN